MFRTKIDFFYLLSVLLPALLIAMAYFNNPTLIWIIIALSCVCIARPDALFPVYFISSLSNSYFSLGQGESAGRYLSLILILSLLVYVFRYRKSYLPNKYYSLILILIVLTFFSSLYGTTASLLPFLEMAQNLLVLLLLPMLRTYRLNRTLLSIFISCAILIIVVYLQALSNDAFLFEQRYNVEGEVNSNRIGMMMAQCSAIISVGFVYVRNKFAKGIIFLLYIICFFVILATGSRAAMISSLSAVLITLTFGVIRNARKVVVPLLFVLVGGYFVVNYVGGVDSSIIDRFSYEDLASRGGTGRADNNRIILLEIFPEHILFGSGVGGTNMKELGKQYNLPNLAHNIIVDPLSQMGIILFSLYVILIFRIIKETVVYSRSKTSIMFVFGLIPFYASCFNGIGETIFYEKFFWNEIALCLWSCNLYINKMLNGVTSNGTL